MGLSRADSARPLWAWHKFTAASRVETSIRASCRPSDARAAELGSAPRALPTMRILIELGAHPTAKRVAQSARNPERRWHMLSLAGALGGWADQRKPRIAVDRGG